MHAPLCNFIYDSSTSKKYMVHFAYLLAGWCSGYSIGLVINRLRIRFPAMGSWVSSWMGDRLWAGKPSLYETGQLRQLSLPSLLGTCR